MISINYKGVLIATLLYIYLPVILFLIGWCQYYISVPITFIIAFVLSRMYKDYAANQENISISKYAAIFIPVFFAVMAYYLGWGRFAEQTNDYGKHNAILNDLKLRQLPVIYTNIRGEHSMLTYYLGHYLVPAAIGKIFSSYRITECAFAVWSYLGICLAYLHLIRIIKISFVRDSIALALVLLFFSCPLSIALFILPRLYDGMYVAGEWFWWSNNLKLQYSSNWSMLQWVVPQTLLTWIAVSMLISYRSMVRYYVPLLLPLLFSGTLAFLGVLPFAFLGCVQYFTKVRSFLLCVKESLSIDNLLTMFSLGIVFILYFMGNINSPKPNEVSFQILDYHDRKMLIALFIVIMVLPYFILLLKTYYKNSWYYMSFLILLLLPFCSMGLMNDLMMRTSIPALYILMILLLKFIFNSQWHKESLCTRASIIFSIILIAISSYLPLTFLSEQIKGDHLGAIEEDKTYGTMAQFSDRNDPTIRVDRVYNYFTYDLETSFFYRYIAHKNTGNSDPEIKAILPPDQR